MAAARYCEPARAPLSIPYDCVVPEMADGLQAIDTQLHLF